MLAVLEAKERCPWWAFRRGFGREVFRACHRERAMKWLEYVGLAAMSCQRAAQLSFGQQKLLSLARLLAGGFPVLLLDEPTAGLSPLMAKQMGVLIRQAVAEHQMTVALIEHNMTFVAELAHWIYFMHEGRIAFTGRADHVLGDREVRQIYMGI